MVGPDSRFHLQVFCRGGDPDNPLTVDLNLKAGQPCRCLLLDDEKNEVDCVEILDLSFVMGPPFRIQVSCLCCGQQILLFFAGDLPLQV